MAGPAHRRVIVQKVDLDTALTALIMGVSEGNTIVRAADAASPEDLADPAVLCIEAGGSGQTHLNNFDHHNTQDPLPPACRQALDARAGRQEPGLARLVDYVALLDEHGPEALRRAHGPLPEGAVSLAGVFAGMLLNVVAPRDQVLSGITLLRRVLALGQDPFGPMPELPEWREYIAAWRRNRADLADAVRDARPFTTRRGLRGAFLETRVFGTHGVLYSLGYALVVLFSPAFGDPPAPKYTVGGNDIRVDGLLPALNARDPGWSGPSHGTIIGSPRGSTRLSPDEVVELVRQHL